MKKIFLILCFFLFIDGVSAGDLYISKKDIDTGEFVYDCDFLLYDEDDNIIDNWIQGDSYHVTKVDNGLYRLVSRPFVSGVFNESMAESYVLNVNSGRLQVTIYDRFISIPPNLGFNNRYLLYGFIFVFIGVCTIFYCKYYF